MTSAEHAAQHEFVESVPEPLAEKHQGARHRAADVSPARVSDRRGLDEHLGENFRPGAEVTWFDAVHQPQKRVHLGFVGRVLGVFPQAGSHYVTKLGPDRTRLDNDDLYVEGGGFHTQAVRPALEGVFGGVVPSPEGSKNPPSHRRDVDDSA